jgi:hypothetical protein
MATVGLKSGKSLVHKDSTEQFRHSTHNGRRNVKQKSLKITSNDALI